MSLSGELREIAAKRVMADRTRHLLRNLANRIEVLENDNAIVTAMYAKHLRTVVEKMQKSLGGKS